MILYNKIYGEFLVAVNKIATNYPVVLSQCASTLIKCTVTILLIIFSQSATATLIVRVDSNEISLNDSVQMTISSDSGDPAELDLSPVLLFFDLGQRSSSTNVRIINGNMTTIRTMSLLLLPKRSGNFVIPAFDLAGDSSKSISINVVNRQTGTAKSSVNTPAMISIEANVSSARLQQQIIVTMRLRFQINVLIGSYQLDEVNAPNSFSQRIEETNRQENINGIFWQVVERRYALFPQKSGELVIPPVSFQASLLGNNSRRSLFSRPGKPFFTRSNDIRILVKPPTYTDEPWLPANNLTVTSTLDKQQVRVGEPVTRKIQINTRGQIGEQIPQLSIDPIQAVQTYKDSADVKNSYTRDGIDGKRVETMIIIPEQQGTVVIPDQQIIWWDVGAKIRKQLTIPGHSIEVLPAQLATSSQAGNLPPTSPTSPTNNAVSVSEQTANWPLWILSLVLLASIMMNLWQWRKNSSDSQSDDSEIGFDDEQKAYDEMIARVPTIDADKLLPMVNSWLEQMSIQTCLSLQQYISLLKPHCQDSDERQQLDTLHSQLNQWVYKDGQKPQMKLCLELSARLRKNYGYPKNYSIPGFSLEQT